LPFSGDLSALHGGDQVTSVDSQALHGGDLVGEKSSLGPGDGLLVVADLIIVLGGLGDFLVGSDVTAAVGFDGAASSDGLCFLSSWGGNHTGSSSWGGVGHLEASSDSLLGGIETLLASGGSGGSLSLVDGSGNLRRGAFEATGVDAGGGDFFGGVAALVEGADSLGEGFLVVDVLGT